MKNRKQADGLERFRAYLMMLARVEMRGVVREKHNPSDMVQLTFLQAHRGIEKFEGTTEEQMRAWLRRILARNLAHAYRDLRRDRRDAALEESLEGALDRSSARLAGMLRAKERSPVSQVAADERILLLARAIEELPVDQRQAVVLHYFHELRLREVAERLSRSKAAAAGLIRRGLSALRENMGKEDHGNE